jgi:hypothetical protein
MTLVTVAPFGDGLEEARAGEASPNFAPSLTGERSFSREQKFRYAPARQTNELLLRRTNQFELLSTCGGFTQKPVFGEITLWRIR